MRVCDEVAVEPSLAGSGPVCPRSGRRPPSSRSRHRIPAMEFLNFVLIFTAGYLVWRRPDREALAFRLLVASTLLMVSLFLIGTRGSLLPPFNY